jgi:hypothetical protein
MVVISSKLGDLAAQLRPMLAPGVQRLMIGGTIPGWDAAMPVRGARTPHLLTTRSTYADVSFSFY